MDLTVEPVGQFRLVNDTHLVCGTKMRGYKFFETLPYTKVVTVASSTGYGQVAVAWCCQQANLECIIYVAGWTKFTDLAKSYGAKIISCRPGTKTSEMERRAKMTRGAYYLQCGLVDDGYIEALADNIRSFSCNFERIWVVGGSCTIALALRKAFPDAHLNIVQVGFTIWDDIQDRLDRSKITLFKAPEKFYQPAEILPPYPSLATYDAKLWRFVLEYGLPGDVIWNVK